MPEQCFQTRLLAGPGTEVTVLRIAYHQPAPLQVLGDARDDGPQQRFERGWRRWGYAAEAWPDCGQLISAIEQQNVEMDVEVQRAAKALDECHGTGELR